MSKYSELIDVLRSEAEGLLVEEFPDMLLVDSLNDAADAIEKLTFRKRPVKRLSCICGRKRLETWHCTDGSGLMFLKCPNCGREGKSVKKKIDLNRGWNEMINYDKLWRS